MYIAEFVISLAEPLDLSQVLTHQSFEAVVLPSNVNTRLPGELLLDMVRTLLKQFYHPKNWRLLGTWFGRLS